MDGEISPHDVAALLDGDARETAPSGTDESGEADSAGDHGSGADVRVVDVRNEASFTDGHIPGSECIPFPELPRVVDRLDGADRVVTVCPHGKASVRAARILGAYGGLADGARVESMAGGLEAWEGELVTSADDGAASEAEATAGEAEATAGDPGDADAPF